MSKQEMMKLQTCVLKVNIDCDGCKHKIKKLLQKIDGVYTTSIDAEHSKVTVTGNVDPYTIIKKLEKKGKHAELWGGSKGSNFNQAQLNNQFKNMAMPVQNAKGGGHQQHPQKGGGGHQQQPQKGGGGHQQQHQQMKGGNGNVMKAPQKDQKSVKFNLPAEGEEFDGSDFDEYDDEFDDDEFDDDDYDEEEELDHGHHQMAKNKAMGNIGNGAQGGPYGKMMPMMGGNNGHGPHVPAGMMNMLHAMNDKKLGGGGGGGGGGGSAKKGGVIDFPVQVKGMGGNNEKKNGKDGSGGRKAVEIARVGIRNKVAKVRKRAKMAKKEVGC
ncbi:heavy metal-associated isoprenylated plant protein 34-like [Malus domestica]|uniref:heavy metal-associated isoprenylated plant protein 34-like n=1 Tax=Malus domestica TaxID=3750 RepID=UPI0039747FCC